MDICSYPRLIAACHVLLRLLMPSHSPYALLSLTFSGSFLELHKNKSSSEIEVFTLYPLGYLEKPFISTFDI